MDILIDKKGETYRVQEKIPKVITADTMFQVLYQPMQSVTVNNLSAMQETQAQSLGHEDLEKGLATHFSVLAWRIPMDRGAWQATVVHGVAKSQT